MSEELKVILGFVGFTVFVMILAFWLSVISCNSRWADYGQTKYSINTGCMVHYKGKWTPATAIREI